MDLVVLFRGRNNPADRGVEDNGQQVPGSERHKETPDVLDGICFSNIFHEEMKDKPAKETLGRW